MNDPHLPAPSHPPQSLYAPPPSGGDLLAKPEPDTATAAFEQAGQLLQSIRREVSGVFVGQQLVMDQVLAALLCGGHVLIEGLPGLGKTHLVVALARTMGGLFKRIQFTPDLMPSDVMGHSLYDMGQQTFRLRKGPVFTNFLLADEINRAPAKTQSALLEVMQEVQVTIDGETLKLDPPFMVLATQNPIEQEGTYPLPEAQLDRFLMKILINYPSLQEEEHIVTHVCAGTGSGNLASSNVRRLCEPAQILEAQKLCAQVRAEPQTINYAVRIVRATREAQGISLGAGTRGAIALVRVAKAYALLSGRSYVIPDDIKNAAFPVLRHRVILAPELAISGQQIDQTLDMIIRATEAPRR